MATVSTLELESPTQPLGSITWDDSQATVRITPLASGARRIEIESKVPEKLTPVHSVETTYPMELIKAICAAKGPLWLASDIALETGTERSRLLEQVLLSYIPPENFVGKSLLEFGCGTGISAMRLCRMLPHTRITGVDMLGEMVAAARLRADYYGYNQIEFLQSPSPTEVPQELGAFDFIMLLAVFEHMLPEERRAILPVLWSLLKRGGVMFIFETPNRWWPFEDHTTHLPLLNYLPSSMALKYARRCSSRVARDESWATLLRRGIRGGSIRELRRLTGLAQGRFELLKPSRLGFKSRVSLCWGKNGCRQSLWKRATVGLLEAIELSTGKVFTPGLELAIRKIR